jgi:hypothetical protein
MNDTKTRRPFTNHRKTSSTFRATDNHGKNGYPRKKAARSERAALIRVNSRNSRTLLIIIDRNAARSPALTNHRKTSSTSP